MNLLERKAEKLIQRKLEPPPSGGVVQEEARAVAEELFHSEPEG